MEEIWKTRSDLNDVYISNLGRYKYSQYGTPKQNKGNSRNGYVKIMINRKNFTMHRLVAELFCHKECNTKNLVDHINGLRDDNSHTNLRWVNHSENNKNKRFDGIFLKSHLINDNKKIIEELTRNHIEMYNRVEQCLKETDWIHQSCRNILQKLNATR